MLWQPGNALGSAASAAVERYRDVAALQVRRIIAKPAEFAAALPVEPSVIARITEPPAMPTQGLKAATAPTPVFRSVPLSPALAKRGAEAYRAGAMEYVAPPTEAPSNHDPLDVSC